jgi:hypothetical protein
MKNTLFIACAIISVLPLTAYSDGKSGSQNSSNQTQIVTEEARIAEGPESTKSPMWQYVVNNAQRTLDEYAISRNPDAVFFGRDANVEFIKQYGGEFEGRHLLKILNEHGGNTSFAMLLPLFDENSSSEQLDDESILWEVVVAKYNGIKF